MRYGTRTGQALCAVALVAGFALSTASAAGAAQVDRDDWADTFCGAFVDFGTVATSARQSVEQIIDGIDTSQVKSARKQLESLLTNASAAAEQARDDIANAGTPDVAKGAKISATVATALDRAALVFSLAAKDVSEFPNKAKRFQSSVKELESDVDDELEKIGNSITKIGTLDKGGLIDAAISKSSACEGIV